MVQEAVAIPGSAVRLMYHSSRAKGYYSTIQLQLTPDTVPEALVRVHLVISIEGVLEEKLFEADPRLQHTYYWDRLNIYRQRVSTANIFITSKYFYSEPIAYICFESKESDTQILIFKSTTIMQYISNINC